MISIERMAHACLAQGVTPSYRNFIAARYDVESVQRERLAAILKKVSHGPLHHRSIEQHWSWETFSRRLPVTRYGDWCDQILRQQASGHALLSSSAVVRYQPTSGSSTAIKWIPYSREFLNELDHAISPWVGNLYRSCPEIARGRHYWSLSWLPESWRHLAKGDFNDDMTLLSFGKQWLARLTQAVPGKLANVKSSNDALFATTTLLAGDQRLAVLSVWSPVFALMLMDRMAQWHEEISECLMQGHWGERDQALSGIRCPRNPYAATLLQHWNGEHESGFYQALWPQLVLISAWDTASSDVWAKRLQQRLPDAVFEGKGLWATEGVVTIPFKARYPLAYQSHFYEFQDLDTGRILPSWLLQTGQQVMPLLTTGSGLLRYALDDRVEVTGFYGDVPCLKFLGRNAGVDLVGEKLTADDAISLFTQLNSFLNVTPVTLIGVDSSTTHSKEKPGYLLLLDSKLSDPTERIRANKIAEHHLCRNFHYKLARELGQLADVKVISDQNMHKVYMAVCRSRGMVEGNIKIEPLIHWQGELPLILQQYLQPQNLRQVAV